MVKVKGAEIKIVKALNKLVNGNLEIHQLLKVKNKLTTNILRKKTKYVL